MNRNWLLRLVGIVWLLFGVQALSLWGGDLNICCEKCMKSGRSNFRLDGQCLECINCSAQYTSYQFIQSFGSPGSGGEGGQVVLGSGIRQTCHENSRLVAVFQELQSPLSRMHGQALITLEMVQTAIEMYPSCAPNSVEEQLRILRKAIVVTLLLVLKVHPEYLGTPEMNLELWYMFPLIYGYFNNHQLNQNLFRYGFHSNVQRYISFYSALVRTEGYQNEPAGDVAPLSISEISTLFYDAQSQHSQKKEDMWVFFSHPTLGYTGIIFDGKTFYLILGSGHIVPSTEPPYLMAYLVGAQSNVMSMIEDGVVVSVYTAIGAGIAMCMNYLCRHIIKHSTSMYIAALIGGGTGAALGVTSALLCNLELQEDQREKKKEEKTRKKQSEDP